MHMRQLGNGVIGSVGVASAMEDLGYSNGKGLFVNPENY